MYPGVTLFSGDPLFGDTFRFEPGGFNQLWGRLTGVTPADTVLSVAGGIGCGE